MTFILTCAQISHCKTFNLIMITVPMSKSKDSNDVQHNTTGISLTFGAELGYPIIVSELKNKTHTHKSSTLYMCYTSANLDEFTPTSPQLPDYDSSLRCFASHFIDTNGA